MFSTSEAQHQTHLWLTTREAASYLKCSEALLNSDRSSRLHGIPYYKLGRHIRYLASDLDSWLANNKVNFSEA